MKNGIELLSYIINNHKRYKRITVFSTFLIRLNKLRKKTRPHSSSIKVFLLEIFHE